MEENKAVMPDWFEDDEIRDLLQRIRTEHRLSDTPEFPEESFEMFSDDPLEFE